MKVYLWSISFAGTVMIVEHELILTDLPGKLLMLSARYGREAGQKKMHKRSFRAPVDQADESARKT
jgi:hypothetical protein